MPYKSQAQRKYFHFLEEQGKLPKKTVDEFDDASKGMSMPEEVEHYAMGGMIHDEEDESQPDMNGDSQPNDHEYAFEDESPLKYMTMGGKVSSMKSEMAKPKRIEFVRALKRGRFK